MAEDPTINFDDEEFYFTVMNSEGEEIELIENGREVRVTNANKKDYARKVAKHYLVKDVREEVKAFLKGFYQVIPQRFLRIFDKDEIDFLMGGI